KLPTNSPGASCSHFYLSLFIPHFSLGKSDSIVFWFHFIPHTKLMILYKSTTRSDEIFCQTLDPGFCFLSYVLGSMKSLNYLHNIMSLHCWARATQTPIATKLTMLCDHLESHNLTPQRSLYITAFLNHLAKKMSFRCCFWDTKNRLHLSIDESSESPATNFKLGWLPVRSPDQWGGPKALWPYLDMSLFFYFDKKKEKKIGEMIRQICRMNWKGGSLLHAQRCNKYCEKEAKFLLLGVAGDIGNINLPKGPFNCREGLATNTVFFCVDLGALFAHFELSVLLRCVSSTLWFHCGELLECFDYPKIFSPSIFCEMTIQYDYAMYTVSPPSIPKTPASPHPQLGLSPQLLPAPIEFPHPTDFHSLPPTAQPPDPLGAPPAHLAPLQHPPKQLSSA
ncbi:hypothetical protein VP01_5528g1, partial [Puccinia sorghi]